jgi:hypothetical protein
MNHEIHEIHEKRGRDTSLNPAADFTCAVKRIALATPSPFVCFVYFVVPTAVSKVDPATMHCSRRVTVH